MNKQCYFKIANKKASGNKWLSGNSRGQYSNLIPTSYRIYCVCCWTTF